MRVLRAFCRCALRCNSLCGRVAPLAVLCVLWLSAAQLLAQNACTALTICDAVFVQPNINQGGRDRPPSSCLRDVRNAAWYRLRIGRDGFLGFTLELTPQDQETDDYDFAIYDATGGKTCADLTLFDERSCNYSQETGNTGANGQTTRQSVSANGGRFNARIPVKAGEEYLLLVSNYEVAPTSKGYRLNFASSTPGIFDRTSAPVPRLQSVRPADISCIVRELTVNFSGLLRCQSVSDSTFVLRRENLASELALRVVPSERCALTRENYEQTFRLVLPQALSQSGQYRLEIRKPALDLCGNAVAGSTSFTIALEANALRVELGAYDFVCEGGTAYIGSTLRTASGQELSAAARRNLRFRWADDNGTMRGETRDFLSASKPSLYALLVEDTVSGCVANASFRIRQGGDFKPRIVPNAVSLCPDESAVLDAGADIDDIQWFFNGTALGSSSGGTGRFLRVTGDGAAYTVAASRNGCRGLSDAVIAARRTAVLLTPGQALIRTEGNAVSVNVPASRYEWALDGVPFASGRAQKVVPPRSGKVSVRLLSEDGCATASASIGADINFVRLPAEALLRLPDTLQAAQNELLRLPMLLETQNPSALQRSGVTGFRARLRMNARLLSPEDMRLWGDTVLNSANNAERTVRVEMPLSDAFFTNLLPQNPRVLDSYTFRTMLGNTAATMILLDSLETMPLAGMADVQALGGMFRLMRVSTQSTIRLITGATIMLTLQTAPNPASEAFEVLARVSDVAAVPAPMRILRMNVYDIQGKSLYSSLYTGLRTEDDGKSILHRERISTQHLSQGAYMLVVRFGEEVIATKRIEVVR